MSFAEQLRRHLSEIGRNPPPIKALDLGVLLEHYLDDVENGMDPARAWRNLATMLEANLRTALGEGIGDREIGEYGVRVTIEDGRIVFHDPQGKEILSKQREHNLKVYKDYPEVITYFNQELDVWENVWRQFTDPLTKLIEKSDISEITDGIKRMGWQKRGGQKPNGAPELSRVSPGLISLFPNLRDLQEVELWEHPIKKILVSPPHLLHHNGETSIARLIRFVYIPKINQFAFLECGLFTAYTTEEITQFFTLNGEEKPRFTKPEEILSHVANLAEHYNALPPHAVFNEIIKTIGYFKRVKVDGKIAGPEISRTLDTQIAYVMKILEFEIVLCKDPALRATVQDRLKMVTSLVLHSLLRAKELDVGKHVAIYKETYLNHQNALHPHRAKRDLWSATVLTHPDFTNRVFSVFDCGQGTLLGGLKTLGSENLLTTLGLETVPLLRGLVKRELGITTRQELVRVCRALGKDPDLYSTIRKCGLCDKPTFVWPFETGGCNICPVCEYMDDYGLTPNDLDFSSSNQVNAVSDTIPKQEGHKKIGVSIFVTALFSHKKPVDLANAA